MRYQPRFIFLSKLKEGLKVKDQVVLVDGALEGLSVTQANTSPLSWGFLAESHS